MIKPLTDIILPPLPEIITARHTAIKPSYHKGISPILSPDIL
jgi:hypothetical protein